MARFFKPLLGAVALAAATLTSTGAFAAYNYNAQITVTAPKGSTAEAAAKNKTLPAGVKYSTCAADISVSGINVKNPDYLQLTIKYDAGKLADELADVYVVLQDLSTDVTGAFAAPGSGTLTAGIPTAAGSRFLVLGRDTSSGFGTGTLKVVANSSLAAFTAPGGAAATDVYPFVSKADNLGIGAQTEVLLGGSINLAGLSKGLWAATVIIAKPGASGYKRSNGAATSATSAAPLGASTGIFLLSRPETWAAHDTVIFELGSPLPVDPASTLSDVDTEDAATPGQYFASSAVACQ